MERGVLYVVCFGTIYGVAQLNPHGFLKIMEVITSLALNMEAGSTSVLMSSCVVLMIDAFLFVGFFVCLMVGKAHYMSDVKIAYDLQRWMFEFHYVVVSKSAFVF
jgi:hypothetical protein